jgi:cytochrome c-type biogenesis protein CcmH/NrfG
MKFDRFDKILVLLLAFAVTGLAVISVRSLPTKSTAVDTRSMERELAVQARTALIDRLFAPVTAAMNAGQYQEALLKLEEVNVRYPGEAHGFILKGEILNRLESLDGAAAAFVRGVKLNGDYIDRHSSVSRRAIIEKLLERSMPKAVVSYRNSPGNPALKENLANLNYLKSRLAGGCE